jgi:predicted metallopeptidase
MAEEKSYEQATDANDIIVKLCERYPEELWAVMPDQVMVLGISNKERPKSMKKLASIHRINPASRAMLHIFGGKVKFYIEVYFSDWREWSNARRQWIIFHELMHIPGPDESGLIKHDVEDFGGILDVVGVDWFSRESLPDLLDGEKVPFKNELFVRLHRKDKDGEDGGEDD